VRDRTARAAAAAEIDLARAAKRQKREDQFRAEMSIELYGWDPRENYRYDLILNTGRLQVDVCVEIILAASTIKNGMSVG